ncbi:MAG: PhzF family phenazine biosynthesis protein [Calditrichaeota bacterium]|nr:PhzF family phenazine biosynthesis protein [Calditrichota bacterium]
MKKLTYYIVDVFAERPFSGNQLAVFRNAAGLSSGEMESLAREMNFSETVFLQSDQPDPTGAFSARIFTPNVEVPFAGHPVLGTARVIQQFILQQPVAKVVLNLKVGPITVTFNDQAGKDGVLAMNQMPPTFGDRFYSSELSKVLRLPRNEFEEGFPIQTVSTGLPAMIVPLRSEAAVNQCEVDLDHYYTLLNRTKPKSILVFGPANPGQEANLSARVFVHYFGIPEDPATGSANGCLAAYLSKYRYFGSHKVRAQVSQGVKMHRPSMLYLEAENVAGDIVVSVGGRAIVVASGKLL